MPLCFTTNKVHYARHGTYHIQHLKQLENSHPGTLREIESFVSERKNNYGITQVDPAGERKPTSEGFLLRVFWKVFL